MRKLNRTDLNSVECAQRHVSIDNVAHRNGARGGASGNC
jgi:hypothetical protein